jgi:hypothetical protein
MATKTVLEHAQYKLFVPREAFAITCTFQQEPWLRQQAQSHNVFLESFTYQSQVSCVAHCPSTTSSDFVAFCHNQLMTIKPYAQ